MTLASVFQTNPICLSITIQIEIIMKQYCHHFRILSAAMLLSLGNSVYAQTESQKQERATSDRKLEDQKQERKREQQRLDNQALERKLEDQKLQQ